MLEPFCIGISAGVMLSVMFGIIFMVFYVIKKNRDNEGEE